MSRATEDETILHPSQNLGELPTDLFGDVPVEGLQRSLNYSDITNDICRIVEQANEWSSTIGCGARLRGSKTRKKEQNLRVLIDVRNIGSRQCSNEYKCNRITTLAYATLSIRPPQ
jgi:hypothetical protein